MNILINGSQVSSVCPPVPRYSSESRILTSSKSKLFNSILQSSNLRRSALSIDPDQSVRALEIIPPVRPQRLLTTNVPEIQFKARIEQNKTMQLKLENKSN